jgi:hypothetical protein
LNSSTTVASVRCTTSVPFATSVYNTSPLISNCHISVVPPLFHVHNTSPFNSCTTVASDFCTTSVQSATSIHNTSPQ